MQTPDETVKPLSGLYVEICDISFEFGYEKSTCKIPIMDVCRAISEVKRSVVKPTV
jgi:hypothetical protein